MADTKLIEHFIEHGWARLEGAFGAAAAEPSARRAVERWERLPKTPKPVESPLGDSLPHETSVLIEEFSPAAWDLLRAVAGGAEVLRGRPSWSDAFVLLPPSKRPWRGPSVDAFGWHIDGPLDEPRLLDAPEYGVNIYALWSEVRPGGGGTFFAPGALPGVARHLAELPQGARKRDIPILKLLRERDPEYFEYSGPIGTVLVTHSLIPHAASWNSSDSNRLLAVRVVPFARPLNLFGSGRKTPVEAATLRALEKSGYAKL